LVYIVSVLILTFSFAYVKAADFSQLTQILPIFFATSIIVGLAKTYLLTVYARTKGVWTEYKLWYFGIALFLISSIGLRTPFSSPTRTVHHSRNFTAKLGGTLACSSICLTLAFAAGFFLLKLGGFALIGGAGLSMCLIGAVFDTLPIEPMSGKTIYKFNKKIWTALFTLSIVLYVAWLAQIF
jgi:hypothetical protein